MSESDDNQSEPESTDPAMGELLKLLEEAERTAGENATDDLGELLVIDLDEDSLSSMSPEEQESHSKADALEVLTQLFKDGGLTTEEFETEKARLFPT